jgi:hypothetical protein
VREVGLLAVGERGISDSYNQPKSRPILELAINDLDPSVFGSEKFMQMMRVTRRRGTDEDEQRLSQVGI